MYNVVEKFLNYVQFDTMALENQNKFPSSPGQVEFAQFLKGKLEKMGMEDIIINKNGMLTATLPSNSIKDIPVIGFIAHLDTSPDFNGNNVKPRIFYNYDGSDLILNDKLDIVLSPKYYSELNNYIGCDIITTDGTSLLGADDKAGIAEIMETLEYLIAHPEIEHGKIRVAFTPDEELDYSGVNVFDIHEFNSDIAYTVDGDGIGELNYENFNAACAEITILGKYIHSGEGKNKLLNSLILANELLQMLPASERPEHTDGYEGFYYLTDMIGDVSETKLVINIRDFCREKFEKRKNFLISCINHLKQKYDDANISIEIKDIYFNMGEHIGKDSDIIQIPIRAMLECNVEPKVIPIRGGTDGSILTFKGLSTPNIFTGGHNFHGIHEYIPIQSMIKAVDVLLKIIDLYTKI